MSTIYISRLHYPVTTLGPGRRIGIWFQGCSIRCDGCISADTWKQGTGETTVSRVMDQMHAWGDEADGVTITGGEPFDQPEALIELANRIKQESIGTLLVYTGYSETGIRKALNRLDGCVDAIVSEPYEYQKPDTLPLRGSDNQQLHLLTPSGREQFSRYECPTAESALDAMFDDDGIVWFCGIPKRDDLDKLSAILESRGHNVMFTAQKVPGDA